MTGPAVAEILGGEALLHEVVRSDLDWARAVEAGLPLASIDALRDLGLSAAEVEDLVIPRRTLAHRRIRGETLTRGESDAVSRVARAFAVTERELGGREKANLWLRRPNRALGGAVPLKMLRTGDGARLVEQTLVRMAHGVYS